jgi:hypothetical protein
MRTIISIISVILIIFIAGCTGTGVIPNSNLFDIKSVMPLVKNGQLTSAIFIDNTANFNDKQSMEKQYDITTYEGILGINLTDIEKYAVGITGSYANFVVFKMKNNFIIDGENVKKNLDSYLRASQFLPGEGPPQDVYITEDNYKDYYIINGSTLYFQKFISESEAKLYPETVFNIASRDKFIFVYYNNYRASGRLYTYLDEFNSKLDSKYDAILQQKIDKPIMELFESIRETDNSNSFKFFEISSSDPGALKYELFGALWKDENNKINVLAAKYSVSSIDEQYNDTVVRFQSYKTQGIVADANIQRIDQNSELIIVSDWKNWNGEFNDFLSLFWFLDN